MRDESCDSIPAINIEYGASRSDPHHHIRLWSKRLSASRLRRFVPPHPHPAYPIYCLNLKRRRTVSILDNPRNKQNVCETGDTVFLGPCERNVSKDLSYIPSSIHGRELLIPGPQKPTELIHLLEMQARLLSSTRDKDTVQSSLCDLIR